MFGTLLPSLPNITLGPKFDIIDSSKISVPVMSIVGLHNINDNVKKQYVQYMTIVVLRVLWVLVVVMWVLIVLHCG